VVVPLRSTATALVVDQLRNGRYDEALSRLYEEAERRPGDDTVRQAIAEVRDRMADAALSKLGSHDAAPRQTNLIPANTLGADEQYLLRCIDGRRSIADLMRTSTLGRHRTARVLAWLVDRKLVHVPATTSELPTAPKAAGPIETVLVADANATQASLVRTMLRVSLGRTVAFHSATNADELLDLAAQHKPGLIVLDYRLPGRGDGMATLRLLQGSHGLSAIPALLLVQRIELGYVEGQLPPNALALARPVDRDSLQSALRKLAPGAIAR
jgi:CheY-like chemotaxis protein